MNTLLNTTEMTFSKMFLDLALHDNVEITESMIENMACLEEHWNTVEFELKFEITEQCNLNCSFCHQEFGKRKKNCTNFDLQSYVKIIEEAKKESQIKHIRITGGEPLLHPDLKSFLACAKDAGFSTILNTNATLLTPQKIKDLSPLISLWKISLPSFNKSDTDIITGIPQTWEKKLSSLSRLANAGCNIDLLIVMTPQNIHYMIEFIKLAKDFSCTYTFLRQESNASDRTPLRKVDIEEMLPLLEQTHSQIDLGIPFCSVEIPERLAAVAGGRITCGPYSSLVVKPDGMVHQCYSRRKKYSVQQGFIRTAQKLAAEDFFSLPRICQSCKFGSLCLGGCRCAMTLKDSPIGQIDYLADFNNLSSWGEHERG